ncbi:hypothetical protein K438DRAFT_926125 [Mycena galopus ATCC 62051]|nr:hypothetical protein K438DRAFT_926125 [Mycena galopus ATCC 62051]
MEQRSIVNNVENQVKVRRLEGMMAQLLLETQFGQNAMDRAVEIISSDPTHATLESQYLSAQTMCLIDSLQKLLISGNLVLGAPLHDPAKSFQLVFLQSTSLEVLHEILSVVIEIKRNNNMQIPLESMKGTIINHGVHLFGIGMNPEGMAWELLKIRILHVLEPSAETSPSIAHALFILSETYHQKGQLQSALKTSQQSLDIWSHISESLPEVDNRVNHMIALTIHAKNLLESGQTIGLSTAQNAVALSYGILQDMIGYCSEMSGKDKHRAVNSHHAFFVLAQVLSSLDQPVESYEASKEGFETAFRFPVSLHPPFEKDIDLFLDQICKVAERQKFSLGMLEGCVVLFRNLAGIYPEAFSKQFLWLMHAYTYFSQQVNCPGASPFMENIRLFLEPNSNCPLPELDFTRQMHLGFDSHSGIIEDAVETFFKVPSYPSDILI